MGISPSLNTNFSPRGDITITADAKGAIVLWSPSGPALKQGCKIEFRIEGGTKQDAVILVCAALDAEPGIGETLRNPLGSNFAKHMLEFSRLGSIESCDIENLILATKHVDEGMSLKNVTIKDSRVAFSAKMLNFDNVKVEGSTLYLESSVGGTFDKLIIDKRSTVAGDLDKTIIAEDCCIYGYAVELKMKEVIWKDPKSVMTRTQGMLFRLSNVDTKFFTPEKTRSLTIDEFKHECLARNREFPTNKALEALKGPPVNGEQLKASAPLHQQFDQLGVKETEKLGFEVHSRDAKGADVSNIYLAEIQKDGSESVLSRSLLYSVKEDGNLTQEDKSLTNEMLVVEVLKRILDETPQRLSSTPPTRRSKASFNFSTLNLTDNSQQFTQKFNDELDSPTPQLNKDDSGVMAVE